VSEYQYYGFLAIDRPLDAKAQAALREISSRAQITAISFTNEYNYGEFRGKPEVLLARWFDVHVYSGFSSVRRFAMRLPKPLFDRHAIDAFMLDDEFMSIDDAGSAWIVQVTLSECDLGYGDDETAWLTRLAPLRADVLSGDLRFFYLLWLMQVGFEDFMRDDAPEPLAGIAPLTKPLKAFADFLMIDTDLLAAAAETGGSSAAQPTHQQAEDFIRSLPEDDRIDLLMQVYAGTDPHVATVLRRRVRDALCGDGVAAPRRQAGELRAAVAGIAAARRHREAERRCAAERRRAAEEEAVANEKRRAELRARGAAVWQEVDNSISQRNAAGYEQAASLLLDLREITADRQAFAGRISNLRTVHASKRRFIERLDAAGLR
jgi:hypothetical protein